MLLCWGGRAVWARAAPVAGRALLLPMMSTTTTTTPTPPPPPPPPPPLLSATSITYHCGARVLEVELQASEKDAAETHRFSAELLRIASPAIDNRSWAALRRGDDDADADDDEAAPPPATGRVPAGRKGVGIIRIDPVGNYAVRLTFDDLHNAGIYTWDYLRLLSRRRRAVARAYLSALREKGLSRRPERRR